MNQTSGKLMSWVGALAMAALILDGKTAVGASTEAVQLCIRVLIPSLFPFFVFSPLLAGGNFGIVFRPFARLLRLPAGAEQILLVSFLGGYPVGAAVTAQHWKDGLLRENDTRRMMAFCSNAGPSFLFGLGAQIFPNIWYCWLIWGIHIFSAVIVGLLTPGTGGQMVVRKDSGISLTTALKEALIVMATVCGWVILFRILIAFLDRWVLWRVSDPLRIVICGTLELANGCCNLEFVENMGLRMLLFSGTMGFGGLCVLLQTMSVTQGLDTSFYFPGKVTQSAISILLCSAAQFLLSRKDRFIPSIWILAFAVVICVLYPVIARKIEKRCGNLLQVGV